MKTFRLSNKKTYEVTFYRLWHYAGSIVGTFNTITECAKAFDRVNSVYGGATRMKITCIEDGDFANYHIWRDYDMNERYRRLPW